MLVLLLAYIIEKHCWYVVPPQQRPCFF